MKGHENKKLKDIRWIWFFFFCLMFTPNIFAQQSVERRDSLKLDYETVNVDKYNGSVFTINGDAIRNLPVSHLSNTLGGLIPGFYSRQGAGGVANEASNYWIRGRRTEGEGVLTLVDGQERAFGTLSPHEIESITVLKDAAATALYGMRGANGVILVNTRQGNIGKPQVEFTAELINQEPLRLLKPLGSADYARYYNEALANDGKDFIYSQSDINMYRNGSDPEKYPDVHWLDDYYKKYTWMQRYNLNISGGNKLTRYFVNAGFLTQSGMYNTDSDNDYSYNTNNRIDRYNVRSNIEFDVTPTTLVSLDLYGWYESQNRPGGDTYAAYWTALITPPNVFPAYYADNGNYVDDGGNKIVGENGKIVAGNKDYANAWALINRAGFSSFKNVYGSYRAQIKQDLSMLLPGLKARALISMDSRSQVAVDRTRTYAYYELTTDPNVLKKTGTDGVIGSDQTNKNSPRSNNIELQLSWANTFDKHELSASAFYNQYESTNDVSIPARFQSVNGWANYLFDKRYGLDFLLSYAGCYKFEKGNRFGLFPTVAAGWTISNESFFEGIKNIVPYLKLKGSWGKLGNHRGVDAFYYESRMVSPSGVYNFGNSMGAVAGYTQDVIANPNLTWEKSELLNVALETRLLNNQLTLGGEYFKDKRTDIYTSNGRVSSLYGFDLTVYENLGKVNTQGYELYGNWNSSFGDFKYAVGGTFSYSASEIIDLGQVDQPYPWMSNVGYPIGSKTGLIADGFFNSYDDIVMAPVHTYSQLQPGDIRYKDLNGDGLVDNNDIARIGYADCPQIFYGITLGVSYKGLGVSVLLQGAERTDITLSSIVATPFFGNFNMYEHQQNRWTPENKNAEFPRLSTIYDNSNNVRNSSLWIRDASYLRLKTMEVYYEFPRSLLKKSFIKGAKIFATGYDLYSWDNVKIIDPEYDGGAGSMPITRNVSLGCSIKF